MVISAVVVLVGGLMGQAYYPAKSMKPDTTAPGGFATSDYAALNNGVMESKSFANLRVTAQGVQVTLLNNSGKDAWFDAADSNIRGWLEAKVAGSWKPIQFHRWSTCGNSYHKVCLESGYHWSYDVDLPWGDFRTQLRFVVSGGVDVEARGRTPRNLIVSPEVTASIDRRAFTLPDQLSNEYHVTGAVPTLMPKRMGQ